MMGVRIGRTSVCNGKSAVQNGGKLKGITGNSARLSNIANQFCFYLAVFCLSFERDVGRIFQIANIVPSLIK